MKTGQSTTESYGSIGKQGGSWGKSMETLRLSEGNNNSHIDRLKNVPRKDRRSSGDSWFSGCPLEYHNASISKAEIVAKARRLTDPLPSPLFPMISDPEIDLTNTLDSENYYSRPPSPYGDEESQMEPISEEDEVNTLTEPQVSGLYSTPNSGSSTPQRHSPICKRANSFYTT
eukprot:TRINITY_DN3987_c0_g1_i2.p1 TRINITY_DN3987_c0_g1~~TRINITY_DN3987_c0_g1_i2.p1  ORF type:complete len:173 (-),score=37.44 TRINITY_DN3987_c0_g1_i2:294-812(-)